jgi:hypothetical protein
VHVVMVNFRAEVLNAKPRPRCCRCRLMRQFNIIPKFKDAVISLHTCLLSPDRVMIFQG